MRVKKARSVADYLKAVPTDQRAALQRLRKVIQATAPKAVLGISYNIPLFKLEGHHLVGFAANKNDCSFHTASSKTKAWLAGPGKKVVRGYLCTGEAIRFTPQKPLPASLVKKLVRMRITENLKRYGRVGR